MARTLGREDADRCESWLYLVRDETSAGGCESVDGYWLSQEGADQLRPGERAEIAAEALAHAMNSRVAIVEKLFVGDEEVAVSVIGVFRPSQSEIDPDRDFVMSGDQPSKVYQPGALIV